MPVTTWEYTFETIYPEKRQYYNRRTHTWESLNALGMLGWEMVSTWPDRYDPDAIEAVFKRPGPDRADRGFLYTAECAQILSDDHGVEVKQTTVITACCQGRLKADKSPGSGILEVDPESFAEYRRTYKPRPDLRKAHKTR